MCWVYVAVLVATRPADAAAAALSGDIMPWSGETVLDLHKEYPNIFTHGNRNAASHLWASFILDRAHEITDAKIKLMFSGFCAVSGSPVRPSDYSRYRLSLATVTGGSQDGFMHYCCWPCVCDTQDFIRVDTLTVQSKEGPRRYNFAVIGNPCDHPDKMKEQFVQPFGFRTTTVEREAPMVRCSDNGTLLGATMSDNGYIIISMFFEPPGTEASAAAGSPSSPHSGLVVAGVPPQPGRMSQELGVTYQDEHEYSSMCTERADAGYNSGMGEIFRRVASISLIDTAKTKAALAAEPHPWDPDASTACAD